MSFFTRIPATLSVHAHPAEVAFKQAYSKFLHSDDFDRIKVLIVVKEVEFLTGLIDKVGRNNAVAKIIASWYPNLPTKIAERVVDTIVSVANGEFDDDANIVEDAPATPTPPQEAPVGKPKTAMQAVIATPTSLRPKAPTDS